MVDCCKNRRHQNGGESTGGTHKLQGQVQLPDRNGAYLALDRQHAGIGASNQQHVHQVHSTVLCRDVQRRETRLGRRIHRWTRDVRQQEVQYGRRHLNGTRLRIHVTCQGVPGSTHVIQSRQACDRARTVAKATQHRPRGAPEDTWCNTLAPSFVVIVDRDSPLARTSRRRPSRSPTRMDEKMFVRNVLELCREVNKLCSWSRRNFAT